MLMQYPIHFNAKLNIAVSFSYLFSMSLATKSGQKLSFAFLDE